MTGSGSGVARYTYHHHLRASLMEGALTGVLTLNDVVARKALGATQFQLVVLTMAPGTLSLLALVLAHRFDSVERRKLFLWAGIVGRLVLFLVAAVSGPWLFLAVLSIHGLVQTVVVPAQNSIFQNNYDSTQRGRLFGRASTYGGAVTAVAALGAGMALDRSPDIFRWIYPAAGVAGFFALMRYGAIRVRRTRSAQESVPETPPGEAAIALAPAPPDDRPISPLAVLRETLGRDAGFRRYEMAMMVYGMGFMVMQPIFARLFVDELQMTYSAAAWAKGVVFYSVYVISLLFVGRLHDRFGLHKLGIFATLSLMAFAASAAFVRTPHQAIAAFALYGLGMAGIHIVWSIGPIEFAPPRAATRYIGVHIALVGVRALFGHPLGGAVAAWFGRTREAFVLAAFFFLGAALLMMRAMRLRERGA